MAALKAYMDAAQASGKPVPPELQNAFAQQLQELSAQTPNMTPAQRTQLAALAGAAAASPLLSPEQQKFVQKKILPTAVDLTPQALQATLAAAQTPEQKIAALKAYMNAAQASGKPVPPELQNAFAQQLQELSRQTPNMTPAQRTQLAALAGAAAASPLLSPEQQKFVQKKILATRCRPNTTSATGNTRCCTDS